MEHEGDDRGRHLGLWSTTGIGVGAIVGGGILALAGTAFATTGPSAFLAFALNGVIALITALSFAELASAFPQSGGTYVFAKRVLGVTAAFNVGWVVWFASIMAAALYALGFSAFTLGTLSALLPASSVEWLTWRWPLTAGAVLSIVACAAVLTRTVGMSGNWVNVLKVSVFVVLIFGGLWMWQREAPPAIERVTPFFPRGGLGLLQAMGYTFIALQGFDLIAAASGEVQYPRKVLPRAMLLSLGIALAIYLPLLLIIVVVGVPAGGDLDTLLARNPDTMIADAARNFLGPTGFWLVMLAGILSMLSALLANLFAASRIAAAMARDRTLPAVLERTSGLSGAPVLSLWITAGIAAVIPVLVGDVGGAGAASSLIFLITFAMAHGICLLARKRKPGHSGFRTPWWPWLPIVGGLACTGLALFQGVSVPTAGLIVGCWLVAGSFSYVWLFARRARIQDAANEASDPDLLELRGRSPLVLVPIANPANALTLSLLATCLSPPRMGRVLLLNVVDPTAGDGNDRPASHGLGDVLEPSLDACLRGNVRVEALATVSADPWTEIERVARTHRCASVLLGMNNLEQSDLRQRLQYLARRLSSSCVILQAPPDWRPETLRRVLIPVGGRGENNALRARLLAGLVRTATEPIEIRYLRVVPSSLSERDRQRVERNFPRLIADEVPLASQTEVVVADRPEEAIVEAARDADLVILGMNQLETSQPVFGKVVLKVVATRPCPILVIGHR